MSDYTPKFDVLGYHVKRGELIAASDAKAVIQAIIADMTKDENKIKANAVREAAIHVRKSKPFRPFRPHETAYDGCEVGYKSAIEEFKHYANKLERGE